MIKLILINVLFFFSFVLEEKPIGIVEYDFIGTPRQCELLNKSSLYLYKNGALFIYGEGKTEMQDCDRGMDAYLRDNYGNMFYKDYDTDSLRIREIIMTQAYVTAESIPVFKWTLFSEIKKIGNYTAQKATTSFRGRDYTAWYTEDIPISEGPWKFHGLPGLILSVSDNTGVYSFTATKIEFPAMTKKSKKFVSKGKKVTFLEFIKADDVEFEQLRKESEASSMAGTKITKNPTNFIELNYD